MQPNLLDNETVVGCAGGFHRPIPSQMKAEYEVLIPSRYLVIKDDIPGFHLNTVWVEESKYPRTVPPGHEYEVPLSLNAETCLSEFISKEL